MSRFDFSDNFVTRYFDWRRDFYSNLTTGQKIRHRLLQAMVVVSLCIIVGYITLNKTVSLPDVPSLPDGATNLGGNTSASQLDEDGVLSFDGAEYPSVALSGRREGVYTFLILGIDVTSDATDTIILLTYDTINKTVDGISLLRDTMVNVGYANKKLTHVYGYADGSDPATQVQKGTTAVKNHVANMTGIYPDFYVMLEWEAVGELVDAIGGVEFEVPFNMNYTDPYQNLYINQAAGLRVLDGQDAMEVIRYRKDNSGNQIGDTGRTEIQQDFLMALAKTCLTPEILLKVPAISQIFMDNVTTDLTVGNILAFAQQAQGMDFNSGITLSSMPYVDMNRWEGLAYVGVNSSAMVKLVNQGLNPYVDDIQVSDLKVMVSRSDGSFGVTYSALVDSDLAYPPESDEDDDEDDDDDDDKDNTKDDKDDKDDDDDDLPVIPQPSPVLPDPDDTDTGLSPPVVGGTTPDTSTPDTTVTPDAVIPDTPIPGVTPDDSDDTPVVPVIPPSDTGLVVPSPDTTGPVG